MSHRRMFPVILGLLLTFCWSIPVRAAAAKAGSVVYAYGQVQATDLQGNRRPLRKGDTVYAGDRIRTLQGRVQVRFRDHGFVSLQPNTDFKIDEYRFSGTDDSSARSFFDLVKGGVRFVTGLIGKRHHKNYHIKTTVATIGIRGTGGHAVMCVAGSCSPLPDGGYFTTSEGKLGLTNRVDDVTTSLNSTYYARSFSSRFREITERTPFQRVEVRKSFKKVDEQQETGTTILGDKEPDFFFEGGDQFNEAGDQCAIAGNCGVPAVMAPVGAVVKYAYNAISGGSFIFASTDGFAADGTPDNEIVLGSVKSFTQTTAGFPCETPTACHFDSGSATLVDIGSNTQFSTNWGRWTGSWTFTSQDTEAVPIGDFHYIYSDQIMPDATVAQATGTVFYNNVIGGTAPTLNASPTQVGTLLGFSLDIDFTAAAVTGGFLETQFPDGTFALVQSGIGDTPMAISNGYVTLSQGSCSGGVCGRGTGATGQIVFAPVGQDLVPVGSANVPPAIISSYGIYGTGQSPTFAISGTALVAPGGAR